MWSFMVKDGLKSEKPLRRLRPYSTSNTSIQYDDEADCPSCDIGGRIAGAVIGSLLCGFLLGAGLMYFYLKKFQNIYEEPVPPKDYDLPDTRLDVNRNDGSTYESSIPMGGDQAGIKNHKKLERLVKKPTQKTQEPIEIPSAATPLIHFYESPGEDNPGIVVTPSSTKSIVDDSGIMYSNTGAESLNTQPYESLDIIPEEVEYENSKFNNYEQMT
ncbi:hypothetical protein Bpfe_029996 [Biomphalaria pfeifferi]|uniref:Uncharacterized protein n=1 Tax=Biomphalaria pfeifferi TaxID=112525 RepID=A0AAD8ARL4_BIOPF|nr:hypothetical protein Bpfe_029996 [Biomphalaria pfeifferi]